MHYFGSEKTKFRTGTCYKILKIRILWKMKLVNLSGRHKIKLSAKN